MAWRIWPKSEVKKNNLKTGKNKGTLSGELKAQKKAETNG